MNKKVVAIFRILLLALFVSYHAGATLSYHTHVTESGKEVSHSHPYLPSANHSHSASSFQTIDFLSSITFISEVTSLSIIIEEAPVSFEVQTLERVVCYFSPNCPLRAPPIC